MGTKIVDLHVVLKLDLEGWPTLKKTLTLAIAF